MRDNVGLDDVLKANRGFEAGMMHRAIRAVLLCLSLGILSACANTALHSLEKPGEGPDEFRIVPGKPLETPQSYTSLPAPTPGGANLTDQDPLGDAVTALGGRRASGSGGIPASDAGLVAQASRFGTDSNIRQITSAEDADFRERRSRFTQIRIVRSDAYADVYRGQSLDPFLENERWRRAGARTPSAPPY